MREDQKASLDHKKKILQKKLMFDKEIRHLQSGYLPFLEHLPKPLLFEYFQCVNEEDKLLWLNAIKKSPLSAFSIPAEAIKSCEHSLHEKVVDVFPGYLPLRYMPCLPFHIHEQQSIAEVLPGAIKSLGVNEKEEVFLFFSRYEPVLRLSITDILMLNEDDFPWSNDLCILSQRLQWLIFRSLEDEWRWGNTAMDKFHFNPGEKTIVENGVHSMPEIKKIILEFVLKYGINYDEQEFFQQNELFMQSNADELLVVLKGNDFLLEIIMHKNNFEWKIIAR